MLYIGNDIVDPNESGVKHKETRFVQRVFTETERELIAQAKQPELILWCLWAGKESAFKIISKLSEPPVFAHRKFQHSTFNYSTEDNSIKASGQVIYGDHLIDVDYQADPSLIHACGRLSGPNQQAYRHYHDHCDSTDIKDSEKWYFSEAERDSIRFQEAAAVRQMCKQAIAQETGLALNSLQIIRPKRRHPSYPPYLLIENKQCDIDISLAHHGKWIAWAFTIAG